MERGKAMQLLPFTEEMQQPVRSFFDKCFAALGWTYEPNGRHRDTADIEAYYLRDGCFWCLFEDDLLVGTVGLRTMDAENKIFELKRLFVLPEYQRKGYGGRLLECAIRYAKEKNYNAICLDTRRELRSAQRLYRKNGFQRVKQYNGNDHAEEFFELKIMKKERHSLYETKRQRNNGCYRN